MVPSVHIPRASPNVLRPTDAEQEGRGQGLLAWAITGCKEGGGVGEELGGKADEDEGEGHEDAVEATVCGGSRVDSVGWGLAGC